MSAEFLTDHRHIDLSSEETPVSRRYLHILERWIPVGLAYYDDWPDRPDCGYFLGGCNWYGIETVSGAFAFALAASSPEYDEQHTGCSRDETRRIALKALRYLCYTHDTGPEDCLRPKTALGRPDFFGTKWGERGKGFFPESQCSTTIVRMAVTALLLGDLVDDETWAMLAAIYADYGHRFGEMAPKNGVYFDTQMEENAWTAAGLASVECMLSEAPQVDIWARTARQLMFSTAATPQDAKNQQWFDDERTVARWTGKTMTTLPDYMVENHGMIHPSYTASAIMFLGKIGLVYGIHGRQIPEPAFFNRQRIYDQLKRMTDRTGSCHPVQGMDWPYLSPDPGTGIHAAAALLLKDPDAAYLERQALTILTQQQEGNHGRMYDKRISDLCHDIQDPLIFRESFIALPGYTYLLHRLYGDGPPPTPEAAFEERMIGVKTYPHSGFIFQRHKIGQTSFAWRNCIMALPLTRDGIYTIAPASHSFLAHITVKDRPDNQDLLSLRIDEKDEAFAVAMDMNRAQGTVRQQVLFAGLPDGTSLCIERLTARKDITVERIDQGFLRIINETFSDMPGNCNGTRTLFTPDGSDVFIGYVTTNPDEEVIRTYDHPAWINVDDRLGIVFKGTGSTMYHNRHYFETWWAVADDLTLSHMVEDQGVSKGQTIAALTTLLAPDQTHQKTETMTFIELKSEGDAFGMITENYLALADFDGHNTLQASRSAFDFVPIFAGATTITAESVTYHSDLTSSGVALHPAICRLRVEGEMEVTAVSTGQVAMHNTDDATVHVWHDDPLDKITLSPGEVIMRTINI